MSEDLKEKQSQEFYEDSFADDQPARRGRRERRHNPSLFGPIVLIAIGVLFLFHNMGLLPNLSFNWMAALQLWPLLLILIGVNIVVRQAPRPLGGLLSAIVGLVAVGIFGYVLLFSPDGVPWSSTFPSATAVDVQTQEISYPADDVQSARVEIDMGMAGVNIQSLEDSPNLIEGQISYVGDLTFDTSTRNSEANIFLRESNGGLWWLNPANWGNTSVPKWQIGLSPRVPLDLRLDVGTGSVDFDLSDLTLQDLNVDGGAGSIEMSLPDGDFDTAFNVGAGSATMTLGENGRQQIEIDGGAGSLTIHLPAGREARITVDGGLGSFSVDGRRFTHVSGDNNNDGVWETAGYQNAASPLDLIIDVGAGSVSVNTQ
ncbi:MAG: hypothetical protein H6659_11860 [Ardenticatenaceae bacterium]|nr:hypothetical protein [Ardenticatenaceae bacterium]MCB8986188.1 hypothetical protein [Ardenticatenaceae bacterium]